MKVKLGIDNFKDCEREGYIGMYSNISALNYRWERSIDIIKPNVVFVGEHGYFGEYREGEIYLDAVDPFLKVPLISIYKKESEELSKISTLFVDIQDVGVRTFTYIRDLYFLIENSKKFGYKIIVFDRPNPLSKTNSFGKPSKKDHYDIFAPFLPFIYPFTIGEIAIFYGDMLGVEVDVIKMTNYKKSMYFLDTKLPFSSPSPNLNSVNSVYLYPALVLLEGFKISVGRGTTKPFSIIGAPYFKDFELYHFLKSLKIKGLLLKPSLFVPYDNIFKEETCFGVELYVSNPKEFLPMRLAFHLIEYLLDKNVPLVEFTSGFNFIELLYEGVVSNIKKYGAEKFYESELKEGELFLNAVSKYFIYKN